MYLFDLLRQEAARHGLNLSGWVDAAGFDAAQPREFRAEALLPGCGSILVLGRGGSAVQQDQPGPGGAGVAAVGGADAAAEVLSARLTDAGLRHLRLRSAEAKMRFRQLGEAAGFGVVSPVSGMLLHPVFGPWLLVEAAMLVEVSPFGVAREGAPSAGFEPCAVCAQPCIATCSSLAVDLHGRMTRGRCGDPRRGGGCVDRCEARLACSAGTASAWRSVRAHILEHSKRHPSLGWAPPSLAGAQALR